MPNTPLDPEWMALIVKVPPEMADGVCNLCHEEHADGLVLEDTGPDAVRITAYFTLGRWDRAVTAIKQYLVSLQQIFPDLPTPVLKTTPIEHENWATMWKSHFKAIHVGAHFIITPPWIEPSPEGRHIITIEPAEAFGTGSHETTQGCLEMLEEAAALFGGSVDRVSMLDIGCGSGILSIAGARLGFTSILGVDNDPKAVDSAKKNAHINGVHDAVEFRQVDLADLDQPADIALANLEPLTLSTNRDALMQLFLRFLIVSGVPLDQWDHIKGLYVTPGVALIREVLGTEWATGLLAREPHDISDDKEDLNEVCTP